MQEKIISRNGGYSVIVETREVPHTEDLHVRFVTQYEHSADPNRREAKFELVMSAEDRARLKSML